MRYKPLLILLILFAFICGISSASASDLSNDTDMETYSAEITGINNENQSILQIPATQFMQIIGTN